VLDIPHIDIYPGELPLCISLVVESQMQTKEGSREYVVCPQSVLYREFSQLWHEGLLAHQTFVFTENHIKNGTTAYLVGMENAFHDCYKWEKDKPVFYPIGPETHGSFPYNDCYLCHMV
jgi:hypothetical protein